MFNWWFNWKLNKAAKAHVLQRNKMLEVISKHAMKAHMYFPGVDHRDNEELFLALDWFASNGFIITGKQGEIVGKFATANMDSNELAEIRRSQMKLVQSETSLESN